MYAVDLLVLLDASASAPPHHSNNVVVISEPTIPEETDPSEVAVKKPMPLSTGVL